MLTLQLKNNIPEEIMNLEAEVRIVSHFHNEEHTLSFWDEVEGQKEILLFQIESLKNIIHCTEDLLNNLWKLDKKSTLNFPFGIVLVQVIHSFGGFSVSPSLHETLIAPKSVVTSLVTVCLRRNTALFYVFFKCHV